MIQQRDAQIKTMNIGFERLYIYGFMALYKYFIINIINKFQSHLIANM